MPCRCRSEWCHGNPEYFKTNNDAEPMTTPPMTDSEVRRLLCGSGWSAQPPGGFNHDSYMVGVDFRQSEADVTLACGQTMYFNAACRHELLTPTTLQLTYDSPPACLHRSATFTPGIKLVLPFTLESGDFAVSDNPLSSDFPDRWRRRLRFERHPFPDGIFFRLPLPTDYYGYRQLRSHEVTKT